MKNILSIETSHSNATISLFKKGEYKQLEFTADRQQNQQLFPHLQTLFCELGDDSLDLIILGTGPGSYNGSRVAISTAHGIAATLGCPVVGIPSFYGVTTPVQHCSLFAIGDARRGSYYIHTVSQENLLNKPELISEAQLKNQVNTLLEQHAEKYSIFSFDPLKINFDTTIPVLQSNANTLTQFWLKLSLEGQKKLLLAPVEPFYLRAPFITKSTKKHPLIK